MTMMTQTTEPIGDVIAAALAPQIERLRRASEAAQQADLAVRSAKQAVAFAQPGAARVAAQDQVRVTEDAQSGAVAEHRAASEAYQAALQRLLLELHSGALAEYQEVDQDGAARIAEHDRRRGELVASIQAELRIPHNRIRELRALMEAHGLGSHHYWVPAERIARSNLF